ncbi:MAG: helix-turn-helix transcriptional regulator [Chloroflexi bacterium]|nr:MAG: helix-turn-helix transcriptional regulator [Chloroflexota bacterium]
MTRDRAPLSARERQIAYLAADGLTCQEIADRLSVSVTTVRTHLAHIYEKLGARNRLEMEHKLPPPALAILTRALPLVGPGHGERRQ